MHQLEQLDGELHVAQAAAAQLDLALFLGGRNVFGDPAAHGLHGFDEAVASRRSPDQRRHGLLVAGAQFRVAGDGPRLQQRLELPALGPAGVVALVGGQGPDQRPGLPLRPEVGVHFPQAGFARRRGNGAGDAGGQGRADGAGPGVVQLAGFDHVDDVDVGDVVQFAGAALAHADDGQADVGHFRGAELLGGLRPGHGQGGLDGGPGQVGEFGPDGGHEVQRVRGAEVLDGQVHHARAGRRCAAPRRPPGPVMPATGRADAGVCADGPQQGGAELGRLRLQRFRAGRHLEGVEVFRVADEELAQRLGGAQDAVQRLAGLRCPRPPASAGPGASRSAGPGTAARRPGSRPAAARQTACPGPGPPVRGQPGTARPSPDH